MILYDLILPYFISSDLLMARLTSLYFVIRLRVLTLLFPLILFLSTTNLAVPQALRIESDIY